MSVPFVGLKNVTGAEVVPPPGQAVPPVVVFVLSHGETWAEPRELELFSKIVHGGDLFRASAMLSCPTARYSWTDRALIVSADSAIEISRPADAGAYEHLGLVETEAVLARHAVLAREIRQLTGLPAGLLGEALGVTREQFQRWMSGRSISDTRHGQLVFLHTIARELVRKTAAEDARIWWHTPGPQGVAPKVLLQQRLLDAIHHLIVELPETEMSGLPALLAMSAEPLDADDDEQGDESWSPYESD